MVTLARELTVDRQELFVFDELLAERDHVQLARSLKRLPYARSQVDSKATKDAYRYFSAYFEPEALKSKLIYQRIEPLLREHFAGESFRLERAYVNQNMFGDMSYVHTDNAVGRAGDVTVIYFAHERWRADWGGETLFYDRSNDACYAVSPLPRRLVVFRGSIKHKIGVPTRQCAQSRLSIAFKFARSRGRRGTGSSRRSPGG